MNIDVDFVDNVEKMITQILFDTTILKKRETSVLFGIGQVKFM